MILGGLGDLATRYLIPALAELHRSGVLPEDLRVIGVARRDLDTADYRNQLWDDAVEQGVDQNGFDVVLDLVRYARADATDPAQLGRLDLPDQGSIVFYLALPPAIFAEVFTAITALGLGDRVRVAVEKPFGEDLDSARELNQLLDDCFSDDRVFRVDHFLGHPSIRRLPRLRATSLFASIWDARHLESIEVVWDETIALEGRAGYYDHTGALRDMLQNHLLQVLAVAAMEPADDPGGDDVASARLDVLRRVEARPETSVRARYTAGAIDGEMVPAYVDEPDVDPDRGTETLAEVELEIDSPRWMGTAVRLRSGKALGDDRRCVVLRARDSDDQMVLGLAPASISLRVGDMTLRSLPAAPEPSAYARVLADLFAGDRRWFVSGAEAEEQWRIVAPVLERWSRGEPELGEYPAGSQGIVG